MESIQWLLSKEFIFEIKRFQIFCCFFNVFRNLNNRFLIRWNITENDKHTLRFFLWALGRPTLFRGTKDGWRVSFRWEDSKQRTCRKAWRRIIKPTKSGGTGGSPDWRSTRLEGAVNYKVSHPHTTISAQNTRTLNETTAGKTHA